MPRFWVLLFWTLRGVDAALSFIVKNIPGCQNAILDKLLTTENQKAMGFRANFTLLVMSSGVKHDDSVCKGGHEIDVHGDKENHFRKTIKDAGSYDIPFGCLIPKGMNNLLLAGRCLSADRIAHSSARVMGTCMAMGQAAGTAAAMCVKDDVSPTELDILRLQNVLRDQGAIL